VLDTRGHEELADYFIHDPDHLFKVLRTQVDVVLPDGVAVLNAANPQIVEMAELCDGKVIFYGMDAQLDAISRHRATGERAVYLRDKTIVLADGAEETALLSISSLRPTKASQPECVLAAVAAAWALGVAPELISAGLLTFESSPRKAHY